MNAFWTIFLEVFEWLLALSAVGLIAVLAFLAITALSLKNAAMRNVKRLYEPPLRSAKSIGVTAKGIVQQEQGRVQHIAANVKSMAGDVKEASTEVGSAAKTIHPQEVKQTFGTMQMTLRFITALLQFLRSTSKHQAAHR